MMVRRPIHWILALSVAATSGDPISDQLKNYHTKNLGTDGDIKTSYGTPVADITSSLSTGPYGPLFMEDVVFFDTIAHFNRERIPDRVLHARGSGAFGYFEATEDISKYCKAKVFEKGMKTRIAVRFSTDKKDRGSPETVRRPYGFAIKFYTEDGIWDLVGYNHPVFMVRDAMRFPLLTRPAQGNPATNVEELLIWDYFVQRQESLNFVVHLQSDNGIPDGYRHMNGFGQHAFKMVNAEGDAVYVKFHYQSDLGTKYLTSEKAANLTGTDPDYNTRDLYNAIAEEKYPTWTLLIQVMTFEEAEKLQFNPFDVTKVWPEEDYPLMKIGRLVLNENPSNYFADVEQIAFNPGNLVPGIEPSPDKMLQGRMFAYPDTQRHRLGPNYLQLPVNCPFRGIANYERDGVRTFYNSGGQPKYFPNSFGGPVNYPKAAWSSYHVSGDVKRYNTSDDDNYSQPAIYWMLLSPDEQDRLVGNIVGELSHVYDEIQVRAIDMFRKANATLARRVEERLKSSG